MQQTTFLQPHSLHPPAPENEPHLAVFTSLPNEQPNKQAPKRKSSLKVPSCLLAIWVEQASPPGLDLSQPTGRYLAYACPDAEKMLLVFPHRSPAAAVPTQDASAPLCITSLQQNQQQNFASLAAEPGATLLLARASAGIWRCQRCSQRPLCRPSRSRAHRSEHPRTARLGELLVVHLQAPLPLLS